MNYTDNENINVICKQFLNSDWEDTSFYSEYLAQSFHYICHSTKLLALAIAHSNENQKAFYRRSVKHISEEDGHQYLAETDLKRLGMKLSSFKENDATKLLWEPQYYKISQINTSILGYILGLECIAVKTFDEIYARVKTAHGDKASSFIRVHAEEDPGHVEQAIAELSRLNESERVVVNQNYQQTILAFGQMIQSCQPKNKALLHDRNVAQAFQARA